MRVLDNLVPEKVFYYFEELCNIPHGSTNTKAISDYCVNFAKERVKEVFLEIINFFGGRLFTLVVEEVILLIFINKLHFNSILVKVAAQFVVVVLNYIISKLIVFREKE